MARKDEGFTKTSGSLKTKKAQIKVCAFFMPLMCAIPVEAFAKPQI